MTFMLPEVHDIRVEFDGQCFDGSWYIILGDMIVNYNGYTASTRERKADANEVAVEMLGKLVETHYKRLESIPANIPQPIRLAAHHYVNASDDESAAQDLVASFGESIVGSIVHKQLSWLCINCISTIVPVWKFMCDGNAVEETFNDLRRWLRDPMHPVDWKTAVKPAVGRRDGVQVGDCDACRLEPTADAVASTARYLQSAAQADATAALLSASYAYDEGCHAEDAPDDFKNWLVFDVLPAAFDCKPVPKAV